MPVHPDWKARGFSIEGHSRYDDPTDGSYRSYRSYRYDSGDYDASDGMGWFYCAAKNRFVQQHPMFVCPDNAITGMIYIDRLKIVTGTPVSTRSDILDRVLFGQRFLPHKFAGVSWGFLPVFCFIVFSAFLSERRMLCSYELVRATAREFHLRKFELWFWRVAKRTFGKVVRNDTAKKLTPGLFLSKYCFIHLGRPCFHCFIFAYFYNFDRVLRTKYLFPRKLPGYCCYAQLFRTSFSNSRKPKRKSGSRD